MERFSRLLWILAFASLAGGCGARPAGSHADKPGPLASFTQNGVTVEIALESDASGAARLAGTFTPQQKGFHLYSNALARTTVNRQGWPTLLEIPQPGPLRATGALVANQPSSLQPPDLLVFPSGPVTLRLPVERVGGSGPARAELSVTYMACSAQTCLTPVIDKRVSVMLP